MKQGILVILLFAFSNVTFGSMGASHIDYADGSSPGGLLDGIIQLCIGIFLLYLITKNNRRLLLWIAIYFVFIIGLVASGQGVYASAIMVLSVPAWLVITFLKDKISKPLNQEYLVAKEIESKNYQSKQDSGKFNGNASHSESESYSTNNHEEPANNSNYEPPHETVTQPRKTNAIDRRLYTGGMVYMISGIPHQFNGTNFEEIDTEESVTINGKVLKWNGRNFVSEN